MEGGQRLAPSVPLGSAHKCTGQSACGTTVGAGPQALQMEPLHGWLQWLAWPWAPCMGRVSCTAMWCQPFAPERSLKLESCLLSSLGLQKGQVWMEKDSGHGFWFQSFGGQIGFFCVLWESKAWGCEVSCSHKLCNTLRKTFFLPHYPLCSEHACVWQWAAEPHICSVTDSLSMSLNTTDLRLSLTLSTQTCSPHTAHLTL